MRFQEKERYEARNKTAYLRVMREPLTSMRGAVRTLLVLVVGSVALDTTLAGAFGSVAGETTLRGSVGTTGSVALETTFTLLTTTARRTMVWRLMAVMRRVLGVTFVPAAAVFG